MYRYTQSTDFQGFVQDTIFKSMDADGDGKIDFKEFLVAVGMS
jgi:Ca2+-binding EF-hand superfamily protein